MERMREKNKKKNLKENADNGEQQKRENGKRME